jgi:CysZ protein
LTGAGCLWRGFRLIAQPGLRRYAAVPLFINTALFVALIAYGGTRFGGFIDHLLPPSLAWLHWLLWPLFALAVLIAVFYTFAVVANFVAAPFNVRLAMKVEQRLLGKGMPTADDGGFSLVEPLRHELQKFLFLLGWALPLGLLFFIPGLNLLAPFAWAGFSAWMLALEYCDYPMGNHGIGFAAQRRLLGQRRFLSLGFGTAALVATSLPVVNLFAIPAAVAGATLLWREHYAVINNPTAAADR